MERTEPIRKPETSWLHIIKQPLEYACSLNCLLGVFWNNHLMHFERNLWPAMSCQMCALCSGAEIIVIKVIALAN